MPSKTVGVVGLGTVGRAMAENLLDAGYPLVVHNRSPEPVRALAEQGATTAGSPAVVARAADVVLTSLPGPPEVESVVLGENGLRDGLNGGNALVDVSTSSPILAERIASELATVGAGALDAPVSGGEEGAVAGTLSVMVGGDEAVLDEHRDVLEVVGESITHCGGPGAGQVAKACNQIVVATTLQAVSEALLLAERSGADLESVLEAISGGAASCWALEHQAPRIIRGDFEPGFFGHYQAKDLSIAAEAGTEYGSPLPATSVVQEFFKSMEARGYGEEDHAAVVKVLEDMVGDRARVDDV